MIEVEGWPLVNRCPFLPLVSPATPWLFSSSLLVGVGNCRMSVKMCSGFRARQLPRLATFRNSWCRPSSPGKSRWACHDWPPHPWPNLHHKAHSSQRGGLARTVSLTKTKIKWKIWYSKESLPTVEVEQMFLVAFDEQEGV